MAERFVAINDHWTNDPKHPEFIKKGEVRDENLNCHFKKVPNSCRDDRDIQRFVDSEHNQYMAERRKKEAETRSRVFVQVPQQVG